MLWGRTLTVPTEVGVKVVGTTGVGLKVLVG